MNRKIDYYEILQVSEDADQEVIRAAYRALARKHGPRVDKSRSAAQRAGHIKEAFEVLRNPERRAEYDATRQPQPPTGRELARSVPPRSQRRRRARRPTGQTRFAGALFSRREVLAAALLGAGVIVIVLAVVLLSGDGNGEAQGTPPAGTARPAFSPVTADDQAIQTLARRSIEVLPAGQWPSLYDDFTADFQQRCPRPQFDQAGVEDAQRLGADLARLRFKRLEGVSIQGPMASGFIVGELLGGDEYTIEAAFQRVDGTWKIEPAPGTQGCSAFNRISG